MTVAREVDHAPVSTEVLKLKSAGRYKIMKYETENNDKTK